MSTDPHERRLADKIRSALDHALKFGRRELAEKLRLLHDSCLDEDDVSPESRRLLDRR